MTGRSVLLNFTVHLAWLKERRVRHLPAGAVVTQREVDEQLLGSSNRSRRRYVKD
jgi:hypothetical protein